MGEITNNRADQIKVLLAELDRTLKMSVEKAIRIGQLLTEQKSDMDHGQFLPWLESNFEMSERTARKYMMLHRYRDKTALNADLQEAYQQIEYIEREEKAEQQKHDDALIRERIKTGSKPEGWNRSLEYQFKKRMDDQGFEERKKKLFEEQAKEKAEREEQERISKNNFNRIEQSINNFMANNSEKIAAKEKLKLNIRTDNINQEAIFDILNEYLDTISDVSRKIETAQNIIKYLRQVVISYQRSCVNS